MNSLSIRPQPGEYAEYYERYIRVLPEESILDMLDHQRREMVLLLSGRSETDGDFRYAPGKWSVKEVLGHICDSERIFAYRALRLARNDQTPLAGFEQDDYIAFGPFSSLALSDLVEEFIAVRRSTMSLFRSLRDGDWDRRGVANRNPVSVRALAWIIAGHERHHRGILENQYFMKAA